MPRTQLIEYRNAEPTHAHSMQQVILDGRRRTYPDNMLAYFSALEARMMGSDLEALVKTIGSHATRRLCRVAVAEDRTVGVLLSRIHEPGASLYDVAEAPDGGLVEVESMYVVEDYQGQGIGSRFMAEHFDWAGQRDSGLLCVADNTDAKQFYEGKGFNGVVSFDWAFRPPWQDLKMACEWMTRKATGLEAQGVTE